MTKEKIGEPTENFPDPAGIAFKGKYYAFSTASDIGVVPFATADTPQGTYKLRGNALPHTPEWSKATDFWAPDVVVWDDQALLAFSAPSKENGKRRIGIATTKSATAKFEARDYPFIISDTEGGVIDPAFFKDHNTGRYYLLYKNDGNDIKIPSHLWMIEIDRNAELIGSNPKKLLTDLSIPNPPHNGTEKVVSTIENPELAVAPDGTYVLFFSAGNYGTSHYFTGYATSKNLYGPYQYVAPLLTTHSTGGIVVGPGGLDIFGGTHVMLHGWVNGIGYHRGGHRALYTGQLSWKNGHHPYIENLKLNQ
ncbi:MULTISPECIES: glycoside hydrolase family 43 protein [Lactococcus]|uniref:glycoside hydrolase family 43 protein n=1 Tax=Lactococcus TaxID=1357 RepID=UPI00204206E4|nr:MULTISPECIES: glycoside hydrolase family 43 protein [Lactococcus]